MNLTATLEGGCLCGAVRYRIGGPVRDAAHCHCTLCRKASGAPVVTWFTVAPRDFSLTRGRLSTYKSTPGAERGFCSSCGSPITFFAQTSPEDLDVTACTLDDPETIRPDRHIWTTTRLSWLHMADGLPDREGE